MLINASKITSYLSIFLIILSTTNKSKKILLFIEKKDGNSMAIFEQLSSFQAVHISISTLLMLTTFLMDFWANSPLIFKSFLLLFLLRLRISSLFLFSTCKNHWPNLFNFMISTASTQTTSSLADIAAEGLWLSLWPFISQTNHITSKVLCFYLQ